MFTIKELEKMKKEVISKWGFEGEETICFFGLCEKAPADIICVVYEVFMSEDYEKAKQEREESEE